MKKNTTCLVFVAIFLLTQTLNSQITLNEVVITKATKIETSSESSGSVTSESNSIRYYYYPNLEAYFDVTVGKYIFKRNGQWVKEDNIPSNYRGYSLYNKRHVVLKGFVADNPYESLPEHKKAYPCNYKGYYSEESLTKK